MELSFQEQIASLKSENESLKEQIRVLEDQIDVYKSNLDECEDYFDAVHRRFSFKCDPDPYGLHGMSINDRLREIGIELELHTKECKPHFIGINHGS